MMILCFHYDLDSYKIRQYPPSQPPPQAGEESHSPPACGRGWGRGEWFRANDACPVMDTAHRSDAISTTKPVSK